MKLEIVDIEFPSESFSWGNGRYIIIGKHQKGTIEICRFRDGKPELYDDGSYSISVTGKNNPGITRTGMFYYGDRSKKLERILNIKS